MLRVEEGQKRKAEKRSDGKMKQSELKTWKHDNRSDAESVKAKEKPKKRQQGEG